MVKHFGLGLLLGMAFPAAAEFTGMENGAATGNAAMQQSRQVAGTGQAYSNTSSQLDSFAQSVGEADGEVTFSVTFKGNGRTDVDNAMSQSRAFDGSLYQSRMLNAQGMGNTGMNAYFYPYYYPYGYPYAYPVYVPYVPQ